MHYPPLISHVSICSSFVSIFLFPQTASRVLELGAGCGMASIAVSMRGLCQTVCITDGDTAAIDRVPRTLQVSQIDE
jgi:tRNA1(Val) A37 N6-methylase TrmN6